MKNDATMNTDDDDYDVGPNTKLADRRAVDGNRNGTADDDREQPGEGMVQTPVKPTTGKRDQPGGRDAGPSPNKLTNDDGAHQGEPDDNIRIADSIEHGSIDSDGLLRGAERYAREGRVGPGGDMRLDATDRKISAPWCLAFTSQRCSLRTESQLCADNWAWCRVRPWTSRMVGAFLLHAIELRHGRIEAEAPSIVIGSPPCTLFLILQSSTRHSRQYPDPLQT